MCHPALGPCSRMFSESMKATQAAAAAVPPWGNPLSECLSSPECQMPLCLYLSLKTQGSQPCRSNRGLVCTHDTATARATAAAPACYVLLALAPTPTRSDGFEICW